MLYGAQVWSIRSDGEPPPKNLLKPIKKVQNQCLRRIAGAYRRTPAEAIERELAIPLIPLYTDTIAL